MCIGVGYKINVPFSTYSTTVYDEDNVYSVVKRITGNEELAIEISSWAEIAVVGEIYEIDTISVEVVD